MDSRELKESAKTKNPDVVPKGLLVLSIAIYFLIVLGGMVRNLGAGLSCPDWPLCFGKLIPHFDVQIFSEFFHRLIAGSASILFLFLVYKIVANKSWRILLGRLCIVAILALASQIVLGGLTVLKLLKSEIVTLHLATGTLFFGVVTLMALRANRFGKPPVIFTIVKDQKRDVPTDVWRYGLSALAMIYLQIILGGVVSSNGAGLACPDFPTCQGSWWPVFGADGIVGIQILHRLGALASLVILSLYIFQVVKNKALPTSQMWLMKTLAFALFLQLVLGISNVLFQLPIWMSVAHLAVAELLFALVLSTTYEIRHYQLHQSH